MVHRVRIEGVVRELCHVAVLPGVRRPSAIGFKTDEVVQATVHSAGSERQKIEQRGRVEAQDEQDAAAAQEHSPIGKRQRGRRR